MQNIFYTDNSALFGGNSLFTSGNPDDITPFIMLHNDREKALESYRIAAIGAIAATCKGNAWRQYVMDRCNNKVQEIAYYSSGSDEQKELLRIDKVFKDCNYIKTCIDAATDKPSADLLQSVLVDYDSSVLLDEFQYMYDAAFARHIQSLKKKGNLKSDVGGTRLHDILAGYFDKIPGVTTFNKALRGDYGDDEQIRPPKDFTPRVRKDIK